MSILWSSGSTMGRWVRVCGQMGATTTARSAGWMMGPLAESA